MVFQKCACPCKLHEPAKGYSRNNRISGRSAVMELLELKSSGASKFLSNLLQAESFLRTSIAKAIATGTIEEGQQAIRRQTISASDSCCPIN